MQTLNVLGGLAAVAFGSLLATATVHRQLTAPDPAQQAPRLTWQASIGRWFVGYRTAPNLSQDSVAKLTGIRVRRLSELERGIGPAVTNDEAAALIRAVDAVYRERFDSTTAARVRGYFLIAGVRP